MPNSRSFNCFSETPSNLAIREMEKPCDHRSVRIFVQTCDVSAAIGIAQLARLERFNARRGALARRYLEKLGGVSGLRLPAAGHAGHAWHLFAPLVDFDALNTTRERFIQAMHARGIGVGVHYQALNLFEAFRRLGYRAGDFPNAETIGARTVTLPLHTQLRDEDVERVCEAVKASVRQAK